MSEIRFPGKRFFPSPQRPEPPQASHPIDNGVSFREIKRRGREADSPPPSSVEVKDGGAIPTLTVRLRGLVLN
jgi:hypothetical protein